MFERECTIYAFLLGYAGRLVADVDDNRFADQPSPGINHPAWLLGHLCVVADRGAELLGSPRSLPASWHADFGTGSLPRPDRVSYPAKAELTAALRSSHARLDALARAVTSEVADGPNPVGFLRDALPTVGDLLAHLLTSHEASHIGHLSNWRRQVGLPYLF